MPAGAWPLVGRDEELAVAREALTGGSAGIVISGAAGVGKTRLAEELLAALPEPPTGGTPGSGRPGRVVRIVATRAAATIPFGATASLLGDAASAALPADPTAVTAARQAVLDRFAPERPARGRGPVLMAGIDDAHLLDEASAQLVHHLAASGDARLVVTVRSAEVAPEPVQALWRDGLCRRLELQPLSRDEVVTLLTRALGGPIEPRSAGNLWRATAGNVLFLRELCRDARERGLLTRGRGGVWTWTAAPALGARLQELLAARVGQLTGAVRDVAALLALGEPLPRALLEELTRPDAVEELDRRDLLAVSTGTAGTIDGADNADSAGTTATTDATGTTGTAGNAGSDAAGAAGGGDPATVRLVHPLYAESVRASLGPLETADCYARLAEGLATLGVLTADDRLRIAVWSVSGGRPVPPGELVDAARTALDRGDAALAERLAERAGATPVAALVRGEALAALRRHGEAEAVLAPLADQSHPDTAPGGPAGALSWTTRVAVARLVAHRSPDLPLERARGLAERARALADPDERDLLDATLADTLGFRGQVDEAGELGRRVLRSPNPAARAVALGPAAAWLVRTGRPEDAVAAARAVLTDVLARPDRLPATPTSVVANLGTALIAAGRLDEVGELCDTAQSLSLDQPDRSEGMVALLRGLAALLRGQPATAKEAFGAAVLGFDRAGALGHQAFALAVLAEAEALLGEADLARATWADLPETMTRHPPPDWRRSEVWVRLVQHGDAERAAREAVAAADALRDAGAPFFELTTAYTALQLGALDQAARVEALAAGVQGPLAEAVGRHAAALAAGDGTALERAAADFEVLGLHLFAAEAAVHAALAHRRAGAASRAHTASARAAELRAHCEGARTPTLAHAALLADLTDREREIALLAAGGLTSRQIAERLGISVRTVDNQLGRVYTKLGIAGRRELAAAIERLDA